MVRNLVFLVSATFALAGCSCGAPGDTGSGPSDDDGPAGCSDVDNDGFGVGADCDGADCDDGNPAVHSEDQCAALCEEDPHATGCECNQAEFPEPDHPGHEAASAHKRAVRLRLLELAQAAGARKPDALADQLLLLMDGAWVARRMFGPDNAARSLVPAAAALVDAQVRRRT